MLKPDCVQRGLMGKVITRLEEKGLKLCAMKMAMPGRATFEQHYAEHIGKPFFEKLVGFITSGPVVAMCWEGDRAVERIRKLMGATRPIDSEPGTIRGDFCIDVGPNLVHGSDSVESAERELKTWF